MLPSRPSQVYGKRDLNPQRLLHCHLKAACLPIPPSPHRNEHFTELQLSRELFSRNDPFALHSTLFWKFNTTVRWVHSALHLQNFQLLRKESFNTRFSVLTEHKVFLFHFQNFFVLTKNLELAPFWLSKPMEPPSREKQRRLTNLRHKLKCR